LFTPVLLLAFLFFCVILAFAHLRSPTICSLFQGTSPPPLPHSLSFVSLLPSPPFPPVLPPLLFSPPRAFPPELYIPPPFPLLQFLSFMPCLAFRDPLAHTSLFDFLLVSSALDFVQPYYLTVDHHPCYNPCPSPPFRVRSSSSVSAQRYFLRFSTVTPHSLLTSLLLGACALLRIYSFLFWRAICGLFFPILSLSWRFLSPFSLFSNTCSASYFSPLPRSFLLLLFILSSFSSPRSLSLCPFSSSPRALPQTIFHVLFTIPSIHLVFFFSIVTSPFFPIQFSVYLFWASFPFSSVVFLHSCSRQLPMAAN